jgi:hypothetical protein
MSTKKRRIATYIPTEIENKFQVFKKERGVGDSQALILILTEFLEVSQQVAYSSDSLEQIKSELLSELKSELLKETEKLEDKLSAKIGGLKSELLGEPLPEIKLKIAGNPFDQQELSIPVTLALRTINSSNNSKELSGNELAELLGVLGSTISSKKSELTPKDFFEWTKNLPSNTDKVGWIYKPKEKGKGVWYLPSENAPSLSEGEAEAQSSHP